MANKASIHRYRYWYAKLLRLYSKPYYKRFGEGMEQTFSDLLRERAVKKKGLFGCVLWMFTETFFGVIRENLTFIIMQYRNIIHIGLITGLILLIPLIAMQFTNEVVWNSSDFVIAGLLLFGTGFIYELIVKKFNSKYRVAIGLALLALLLLIWVELAVGLFTNWGS